MKHGSFRAICLILVACIAVVSVFGDDTAVALESHILEPFDGTSEYVWKQTASKFATKLTDAETGEVTEVFPKVETVAAWPSALYRNKEEEHPSLGIWGKFNRQGYNWIDIYPTKDDEAFEIPIPGRVRYLDLWVWGSNLDFYIEAYIRDLNGGVHVINLGDISYTGWKNLRASVPSYIPQSKKILPRLAPVNFIKFRIWTKPTERVDNFYIYFNQFKVLTDMFEVIYDGDELADPAKVQEFWGQ